MNEMYLAMAGFIETARVVLLIGSSAYFAKLLWSVYNTYTSTKEYLRMIQEKIEKGEVR